MSKYSAEKYAESARKHGIPCGPYNGKQTHPGTIEIRYVKAVGGIELCVSYASAIGSQKLCDGFVRACESLPDLLISLDEKDAEIERLRGALSQADAELTDGRGGWPAWDQTPGRVQGALNAIRAALKGGS